MSSEYRQQLSLSVCIWVMVSSGRKKIHLQRGPTILYIYIYIYIKKYEHGMCKQLMANKYIQIKVWKLKSSLLLLLSLAYSLLVSEFLHFIYNTVYKRGK